MSKICDLLISFAEVFAAMSPWLVVGFFIAGVIAVWVPRTWVNRVMGGSSGFLGILRAVLVGVPLPICSCGVLPIATGLRRNGAGKGATAAFLISTPQTGIDSILATYALMGPVFAIARPLARRGIRVPHGRSGHERDVRDDGVAFEDHPSDWRCPRCKQPKEKFNRA